MQPGRAAFSHMLSSSCVRINTRPPSSEWTLVPRLSSRIDPFLTALTASGSDTTPETRSSPRGPSHEDNTRPIWPPEWSCSTSIGTPPRLPMFAVAISAALRSATFPRFPSRRGGGCAICAHKIEEVSFRVLVDGMDAQTRRWGGVQTHPLETQANHTLVQVTAAPYRADTQCGHIGLAGSLRNRSVIRCYVVVRPLEPPLDLTRLAGWRCRGRGRRRRRCQGCLPQAALE